MTIVVDASVALKWLLPEPDSGTAERVMSAKGLLIAPTLLVAEACNAVWKRLRRREITTEHTDLVVTQLPQILDRLVADTLLAPAALRIAREIDHPVYDCFYLALAERENAPLVTADRRLVERVSGTPWAGRVVALDAWSATG